MKTKTPPQYTPYQNIRVEVVRETPSEIVQIGNAENIYNLLGIPVLDHVIIGEDRYYSFVDKSMIKQFEDKNNEFSCSRY